MGSTLFNSLLAKIMNKRMTKICEDEGYLGITQYGFREGKSTNDCVFMLLAALRKAKKKGRTITVAFCDIAKAYDSVDRNILYIKLKSVGFGGKTLKLIQSMYYNDRVVIQLGSKVSAPLWFQRGVKQGCCLSPLLFALYMEGLGTKLH